MKRVSPSTYAHAGWLLPNERVATILLTQSEYDMGLAGIIRKPHPLAVFLTAQGGVPDGSPALWDYHCEKATDPGAGKWSLSHLLYVRHDGLVRRAVRRIPNHHSVTFDVSVGGTINNATSLTLNGVSVTSNANSYIAAMSSFLLFGVTSTTTTWNTTESLTSRSTKDTGDGNARSEYWDRIAPTSGNNNLVFNYTAATFGRAGFASAYGVDQTNPRSNVATPTNGTGTAPAITVTSASDELVFTNLATRGSTVVTLDAGWTSLWAQAGSWDPDGQGAYKAGAASVTRTDAMSVSQGWAMVGVSLAAAKGDPNLVGEGGAAGMCLAGAGGLA